MHLAVGKLAISVLAAVLATHAGFSLGQPVASNEILINPTDVQWKPAPDGAKAAFLLGDPSKTEPFVMRVMIPAGDKVMPHWHSQDEYITVLSGTLYVGLNDKYDPKTARALLSGERRWRRAG